MAHVWNIIDGDIYVSKNGDDVNGDGSMTNPYASINKATDVGADGNKIVIGTGIWQEARGTSTNNYTFIGDGECMISLLEGFILISGDIVENIIIWGENNFLTPYVSNFETTIIKCKLYNVIFKKGYDIAYINLYNSLLIDCKWDLYYGKWHYVISDNCTFINMSFVGDVARYGYYFRWISLTNSIFLGGKIGADNTQLFNAAYKNCIYRTTLYKGNIEVPINTFQDNYGNLIDTIILDPKFNNPEIGDYTLQPTSPCLFAGKNNANIGAYGLGYSFNANSSEFTKESGAIFSQTTEIDDIIKTQQTINGITHFLFQLNAGHTSGNVESTWIDLQTIRYLLITHIFDNLIYNSLGVATSRADNLETAGEKAVYYDFELKYCNEESEKDTATFKNVIWNKAVTVDNSGNGNANSNFVASEAQYISARFIKIKFYMKEG